MLLLVWASLGLIAGAFLDLLIRVLANRREDTADVVCPACETARLDWRLIPLLGGFRPDSCVKCGRRSWQPIILELSGAIVFVALASRVPLWLPLIASSLYACVLIVIFAFDLRHRLILDVVTFPSMLVAIFLSGLLSPRGWTGGIGLSLLGGLFGGGLFVFLYLFALLRYRGEIGLGLGDVKLALLIGLMTGWDAAVAAILLGTVIGGLLALPKVIGGRWKETMPYGTALALGALVVLVVRPLA